MRTRSSCETLWQQTAIPLPIYLLQELQLRELNLAVRIREWHESRCGAKSLAQPPRPPPVSELCSRPFLVELSGVPIRRTGQVLSWAVSCSWLQKNPCAGVKLPRAGTKVIRTILKPEQTRALASNLEEPYATLVLFLAVTGLRISEAIGIKWSDFDGNVLRVSRRIYEGRAGETKTSKSVRSLPIPEALVIRMRKLGEGQWVFRSRVGTTINPGNALKRYIHPASRELGFRLVVGMTSVTRWLHSRS